jgi:hypothetical protein
MVREECEKRQVRFALCGGLAMAAYGRGRMTFDVDSAMDADAQHDIIDLLQRRGYETLHRSAGFSSHRHLDPRWGNVDLVWVRGETADALFAGARWLPGPGARPWPVVSPEHLAAMKLHALSQDPTRWEDWGDLRFLLALEEVDGECIRREFVHRGWEQRYEELLTGG